jgi:hypothetical protein
MMVKITMEMAITAAKKQVIPQGIFCGIDYTDI